MSRVVVACGGSSLERTISLDSGRRASRALRNAGMEVERVDVASGSFISALERHRPDFVFIALHGLGGEDGTLQDLLGILEIPYTGSDSTASALCLDKHLFKSVLARRGIATPDWHSFTKKAFSEYEAATVIPRVMDQFTDGVVVKPSQQGSSLGITVVREAAALGPAILDAMSYDDRVLLEAFIPGRELAVTVLGPTEEPRALPTVELFFEGEIYDYTAHYEIGGAQMRPAELEPAVAERVARTATDAYTAAGCRDFARVDIRLRDDVPHVLEINTIPGLTETGPAPLAAELGGFGFDQFIETISERAARD